MTTLLSIKHLRVNIGKKEIIKDLNLEINPGEIVAIMGPNGSGKSTLALSLAGYPKYKIKTSPFVKTTGDKQKSIIKINGEDITDLTPDERAKRGLFIAFQQPVAIPGVNVTSFLRMAANKIYQFQSQQPSFKNQANCPTGSWLKTVENGQKNIPIAQFLEALKKAARELSLPEDFLKRFLNDGFSGGEKKKLEALQALVLKPKVAIFDEIDTGLDIDALKIVALAINKLAKEKTGIIVITHYQRILQYLKPTKIHILVNGKIVKTGTGSLALELEKNGYSSFLN